MTREENPESGNSDALLDLSQTPGSKYELYVP